jgi:hypothetical protein
LEPHDNPNKRGSRINRKENNGVPTHETTKQGKEYEARLGRWRLLPFLWIAGVVLPTTHASKAANWKESQQTKMRGKHGNRWCHLHRARRVVSYDYIPNSYSYLSFEPTNSRKFTLAQLCLSSQNATAFLELP